MRLSWEGRRVDSLSEMRKNHTLLFGMVLGVMIVSIALSGFYLPAATAYTDYSKWGRYSMNNFIGIMVIWIEHTLH